MKVCFLGDAGSIHIRRWVEFFRDQGHLVSLISFRDYDINGVDVRFVGNKININESGGNIEYIKKIFQIRRIIKEINPDIVNAHYLTSYGLIAAIIKDRPLVVSTWGSDILVAPKKNSIYKKITQYVLKKSNLVTSDSDFMSKEIERLGCSNEKIITAPMGIEKEIFNSINRNNINDATFLSMRTLCDNSNIDLIIKAFALIAKEYKDSKLVITNSGEKEDELKELINRLELNSSVELLGFIDRETVAQLLKDKYIYISIPTSDSTSVTLLEAMASGIFPIVSDLPANSEWITDNRNGLILKSMDEKELYKLMKKALDNEKLVSDSRELNKNIIDEKAIWKNNMNFIIKSYRGVL